MLLLLWCLTRATALGAHDEAVASPALLTFAEAQARLRVSRQTIYGLLARGELASVRVLRRRFVLDESVTAYISRHTESAESPK